MRRPLRPLAASTLALALTGCGFGAGESGEGEATLTVTRDYGREQLLEASVEDPPESETVIRFLDREAEIETRFGGGFVSAIEGLAGAVREGRSFDWFFYVDGIESPIGSADREVLAGQRIWWDYRDWTAAMRVPAVVGSFPEPLAGAAAGTEGPLPIGCADARTACEAVAERLAAVGAEAEVAPFPPGGGGGRPRVLVGTWPRLAEDPAAAQLADGPEASGVFARFAGEEGARSLSMLDETGAVARRGGAGTGLVAAVRRGEEAPTWIVGGVDRAGVAAAVAALDADSLANRYALAVEAGGEIPLPLEAGE